MAKGSCWGWGLSGCGCGTDSGSGPRSGGGSGLGAGSGLRSGSGGGSGLGAGSGAVAGSGSVVVAATSFVGDVRGRGHEVFQRSTIPGSGDLQGEWYGTALSGVVQQWAVRYSIEWYGTAVGRYSIEWYGTAAGRYSSGRTVPGGGPSGSGGAGGLTLGLAPSCLPIFAFNLALTAAAVSTTEISDAAEVVCVCVVLSSSNAAPPAAGLVCDGTVRAAMVIVAVIGGSKRIESLRPVNLSVQYVVNIVLRVA